MRVIGDVSDPVEDEQATRRADAADGDAGEAGDARDEPASVTEQAFHRALDEGQERLGRGWSALLATGFVGGLDVGTGVLALLVVEHATGSKILGGAAFTVGFIALTLARSELFTENFLVPVTAVVARKCRWPSLLRLWGGTLVANLAGGWIITALVVAGFPELDAKAVQAGRFYAELGVSWRGFALGLIGGLAITLMTWMQHTTEATGPKLVAAATTAFLLGAASLNHAVISSLLMFAALHTQHAGFTYADWAVSAGWAALANLVGGIGLVTVLRLLQVPQRVRRERANPAY